MTVPAGPVAIASPERIRTASPLSHLRQTLVESYATADTKTATAAPTARQSPTKTASYSTMPPSSKRLVQQSTEDFVRRTSRSVARNQAQQPQPQPSRYSSPSRTLPRYNTGSNGTQHHWQRPAPIKSRTAAVPRPVRPIILRKKAAPGVLFAALPGEVLELILDELKKLHYADFATTHNRRDVYIGEHSSCATCWMRDACAMALTARKMLKYARVALYEAIEIVGADTVHDRHSPHHHPFRNHKRLPEQPVAAPGSARLVLLLRTLRHSPPIAAMVRSLKVPSLALYQAVPGIPAVGASGTIPDDYETLVASVVMSCPNLERMRGFHPTYDHTMHSRYFQALSTRPRLKDMTWILEPIFTDAQHAAMRQLARRHDEKLARKTKTKTSRGHRARARSISAIIRPHALPSPPPSPPLDNDHVPAPPTAHTELDPRQTARFLNHHVNWHYLSTLTVHCKPGATLAPRAQLLTECLHLLPRLQNLYVSHVPARAFDDCALLALPASLRTLSLVHLPGVTAQGLSAFATRPSSRRLTSLALVHVDRLAGAGGLPALARILSHLVELASLTLVQARPPTLASGETVWLFPYLASTSLTHLHWDILSAWTAATSADTILARSIAAAGFPSLRTLRTPADPDGLYQALCKPQECVDLPGDRSLSFVAGGSHAYGGYVAPAAFAPHFTVASPPTSRAHAHRHSESSSTSSSSIFSVSLAHSRTNSSSLSFGHAHAQSKKPASPPSSKSDGAPAWQETTTDESKKRETPLHSDLRRARMAAQARIDASRRTPRFFVNVTDDRGMLVDKFGMGGFCGTVGSAIRYHLVPDTDASDAKGGLVDIDDFLADGGEVLDAREDDTFKAARVCSGQWNANWDAPQKKDRERWSHTERGRWRGVQLM